MARRMEKTKHPGIYKRDRKYVFAYRDQDGKQRWGSAGTLDAARKLKAAKESDVARGEFHADSRLTFQEYAGEWIERYQGRGSGFRESTRTDYRQHLVMHVYPFFGKRKKLSRITPRDVANLIGHLADDSKRERSLSDATIRNIIATVRSCLATAVREGEIRQNPARGAALPKRSNPDETDDEDKRAMSRRELKTFLSEVEGDARTMFELLLATGMRWSELAGLQWRHFVLDGKKPHVRIRRAIVRGKPSMLKSKYSRRQIPLDRKLARKLRKVRMARGWPPDDALVYQSPSGGPLDYSNTRRGELVPPAKAAGVPWIGFHTFRHTCASILFARGANAVQVQRWLGHHSAAFTLATYVHLLENELGEPLDLDVELRVANKRQTQEAKKRPKRPNSADGDLPS